MGAPKTAHPRRRNRTKMNRLPAMGAPPDVIGQFHQSVNANHMSIKIQKTNPIPITMLPAMPSYVLL
jgi:hypothetical protein